MFQSSDLDGSEYSRSEPILVIKNALVRITASSPQSLDSRNTQTMGLEGYCDSPMSFRFEPRVIVKKTCSFSKGLSCCKGSEFLAERAGTFTTPEHSNELECTGNTWIILCSLIFLYVLLVSGPLQSLRPQSSI